MAAPMQTLAIDTHYSIFRRILAPRVQNRLGGGAMQVRRLYERPVYEFGIHDSHAVKTMAETIYGFLQYHQGDTPFWFAGNEWGNIQSPILVGFGDGARTQFFLNNRNITTSTIQMYVNATPTGISSIDLPSGLVTFGAAPASNATISATYQCTYKCVFAVGQDVLQSEEQFYKQLYKYEGITLQELVP